ncbi:MAG: inositol-3-phosphate synthase, partial [Myxococcales bacterium]|nr:inositol-3-phosphate synthase [Myxococcales bacterium]
MSDQVKAVNSKTTKPQGKLAVLIPGLGAVSTTFIAGVELVRKGLSKPIGSLTQLGTARLGKRTDNNTVKIKDLVPLAGLDDLVFGAWDVVAEDALTVVKRSGVLNEKDIAGAADFLATIKPRPGIHDPAYVRDLPVDNAMKATTHADRVEQIRADIREFKKNLGADRAVMLFIASTEKFHQPGAKHETLEAFEAAIAANDPAISPTMIYAYAGMLEDCPFING